MDIKLNLQDLSDIVAQKNSLTRKEADTFVRLFFETISTFLIRDKIVKVKGLGTFKLVEVAERESVDVNTGRRIVISGHAKVSFTPDSSLRDQVNKPFADFETVVLNDETDISEMESVDFSYSDLSLDPALLTFNSVKDLAEDGLAEAVDEDLEVTETDTSVEESDNKPKSASLPSGELCPDEPLTVDENDVVESAAPALEDTPLEASEPDAEAEEPSVVQSDSESGGSPDCETETTPAEPKECERKTTEPSGNDPTEKRSSDSKSSFAACLKRALVYAAIFLLIVGSYFVGYYRLLCPCGTIGMLPGVDSVPEAIAVLPAANIPGEEITELPQLPAEADTMDVARQEKAILDSVQIEEKYQDSLTAAPVADKKVLAVPEEKSADANTYPQVPGGKYQIVGTKEMHKMQVGDNLYKISRKTYGSIQFVKYIVVYNQFKNPDVIPPGYMIKLPKLKEVK